MSRRSAVFVVVPMLLLAVSCTRSPQAESQRLVGNGNKFYSKEKFKEASIMYRRALAKDAKNGDAYYRLGLVSLKLRAWSDAARSLRRAVDLQPNNADAATRLADLYWMAYVANPSGSKNLVPEIDELAKALLKRDPKSFDGLRLSGYLLLVDSTEAARNKQTAESAKDLKAALEKFEAANSVKPYDPALCLVLAQTMVAAGRLPDAEKLAREVIDRQKNYAPMYDFLLGVYFRTNRINDGEQLLKLKVQNNPHQELFRLQEASFFYATQRRPEMEKVLQDIISDSKDFPFAHLTVGKFFARLQDFDRARREFDAGMAASPKDKAVYQKSIVELLSAQGKYSEAMLMVNDVLKEDPKDSVALQLRSALGIQSGDPTQINRAVSDLQALVSKNPSNPVLRLQLGRALMAQGKPDQARTHLEEANRLRPDLPQPKLLLAEIFVTKHDFTRALALTDELLSTDQRNMHARLIRTSALLGIGDRTRAKSELEAINKALPGNADVQFQLGFVDFQEQDYKEADALFSALRQQHPNDSRGLMGLVETAVARKDFKGATDLVRQEMQKDPNRLDLHVQMASILARSGQYDEAIKEYQFLLSKNPKSPETEVKLAETYRLKGDFNAAVDHFKKATSLAPNQVLPLVRLGMLLDSVGRRPEAKQYYEQIIRLQPDNVIALNNLAYIKAEEGTDLDQAMSYAQRAKQQAPKEADISDTLGWIYIKKNLSDEAVRIFRDLVKERPANSTYHYHLALALFQKGDRSAAKQECDAALKNNPSQDEQNKIKQLQGKLL
jgi:tetratricopeptide (TPR) repeat protein